MTLAELLLTTPASAATGERSFGALKRVKTGVQNRMQTKSDLSPTLASCTQGKIKQPNLMGVMSEFSVRTVERSATFAQLRNEMMFCVTDPLMTQLHER